MGTEGSERAGGNLDKVDHVVVMMLENRSFDHMLGYLSLTGRRPGIDGLRPGFANGYQGRSYPVHHLGTTALDMDPDHSSSAIDQQIAGGSIGGFVASAAATLAERGGFYDHVPPPAAADDEPEMFGRYGVRVPALIVSPWVEPRTVSSTVFDHTSIIKTILARFCPQALSERQPTRARRARLGPQYPGLRVARASHLGELLTRSTPRPAPPRDALLRQAAARAVSVEAGQPRPGQPGPADRPLNDLQKSILAATRELRRRGHPPNAP
jgi:hypothetical protein